MRYDIARLTSWTALPSKAENASVKYTIQDWILRAYRPNAHVE